MLLDDRFGRDQSFGGLAPFFGRRAGRQIEKALQEAPNRVLSFADAEIEHQTPMGAKAARFGKRPHLFDKSGFADARLAANEDDMPGTSDMRGLEEALELLEFRLAADEDAPRRRMRGR